MKKKEKPSREPRSYNFRLTLAQLVGLAGVALLVCLWMFVLGILTGRGTIFTKLKWLGVESEKEVKSVQGDRTRSRLAKKEKRESNEELDPEKLEKQLEFFHKLEHAKQGPTKEIVPTGARNEQVNPLSKEAKNNRARKFFILVASFRKKEMADVVARRLKKYDYKGYVEKVNLKEKGTWYRVCVGNYVKKDEARKHAKIIREKLRVSPLVMLRSE